VKAIVVRDQDNGEQAFRLQSHHVSLELNQQVTLSEKLRDIAKTKRKKPPSKKK
jgi:hypothetical protein